MIQIQNTIQQKIQVHLEFPVCFTQDLFTHDNATFEQCVCNKEPDKQHKVIFFVDDSVSRKHPTLLKDIQAYCQDRDSIDLVTKPIVIPGGEPAKNDISFVENIQQMIEKFKICRHSFVAVIGGGAVLDMVGFACATPHRGVRLIRIPTTVLSQNDAAMGVKNAVNAFNKKNFLGTFCAPYAVINDREFLKTLCFRDWISGISEAIKVALIKDAEFFAFLKEHAIQLRERDIEAMEKLIFRCAELHLQHIRCSGDPFELGYSRPLDFGHWAAHKLESLSGYRIRHGEAVAAGIAIDSYYAYRQQMLSEQQLHDIHQLLSSLQFSLYYSQMHHSDFLNGLEEFREHLGGILCITLPKNIGHKIEVNTIDNAIMYEAIDYLKENFGESVT
ncbi:3-dehydroquinate synthase [Candidatus Uabimicrobium amorphum]|uniref:3-dehydroquinate synthase n=1 Tax=Uabimicrobium amorphum TaxID=2596890 RepID=A0A5S9ILJ3_UABAM|nr:3-dehydroquinate synthase [Candidatus Uabimicrobium amorphum]BBM83270.1 3-dehydroquinate synthase [Candidatus Uabimicrobium amorphum]